MFVNVSEANFPFENEDTEGIRPTMSRSTTPLTLSEAEKSVLLSVFPKGIVAVDLETTGLSPLVDKIIEIAAVKLTPDGEVDYFHQLINPLIDIPDFTIQFHGITNEMVNHSPTIRKPLKTLWDFVGRLPMVAHNSTFDLGYLVKASHDFQIEFPPLDIFDSCRMSRARYKGKPEGPANFKLSTLAEYAQFPLQHHVAMEDTMACLKITAFTLKDVEKVDHLLEKGFVFRLSSFANTNAFQFPKRFEDLKILIRNKKLLSIDYRGGQNKGIRPVRPIGLMPLPQGSVLFAECLATHMHKSFLLTKIKNYEALEACVYPRLPEENL